MSSFINSYLAQKGIQVTDEESENIGFCCPFHGDTVASARFHRDKEIWQCFSCNIGGNIVDFEAKLRGCSHEHAEKFVKIYRGQTPIVPDEEVEARHQALLSRDDLISRLQKERGITYELISKYKIGWEQEGAGRLWVPIYFGEFVINVKRWDVFYRDATGEELKQRKSRKVLPYKKGYSMELIFPYDQLEKKSLMVTEGEGDCLLALSIGIPTITAGSAQSNLDHHFDSLAGKALYLCYDVDDAGRKGCELNAARLSKAGLQFKIVDLTKLGAQEGDDLTDVVNTHKLQFPDFDELISSTPWYGTDSTEAVSESSPEKKVEEIEFNQYVLEKYHHSYVSMPSILIGQDEICKRIPHRLKIQCLKKRTAKCHYCPFKEDKSGWSVNLETNTEKAIGFYYGNERNERELIKEYFTALCDGFDYHCLSKQNLTKVILVPNTTFKVNSKVSLAYGFTHDVYCEFNHSYQVVAKVITNPRNNDINLFIKNFESSASFAVHITEQFMKDHKIFQVEECNVPDGQKDTG